MTEVATEASRANNSSVYQSVRRTISACKSASASANLNVAGLNKRNLIGTVVQKVICQKDGVEVKLVPGILGDAGNSSGNHDTFYTTCIGMSTHR